MKLTRLRQVISLATLSLTTFFPCFWAKAVTFEQQEVNQAQFIAIARPYGDHKYDLLILQQIPGKRQCWREKGANPVVVEPLLLNFDFTGSCDRSTDSNGYSIRIDGQDYGLNYLLRVIKANGELILVGTHRSDGNQRQIIIGRTHGMSSGFLKIILDSGWRFTKRSYGGQTLSHVYLTADSSVVSPQQATTVTQQEESSPDNLTLAQQEETAPDTATPIQEFTFTASSSPPSPPTSTLPPPRTSPTSIASPTSTTSTLRPSPASPASTLPPPPSPSGLPSFSELPPLPPPPESQSNTVVPPPPPNTDSNYRKSLSEVLGSLSNSQPSPSPNPVASTPTGYRVMASAKSSREREQLRSLFPDAFPTSYNGQSLWQIGLFSSRDNAQKAQQSLETAGLSAIIVP